MAEYFVWSAPTMIRLIEAASEQDAAEAFLEQPVTATPVRGEPPACFVQTTGGLEAPRIDDTAVEFWIHHGDAPV